MVGLGVSGHDFEDFLGVPLVPHLFRREITATQISGLTQIAAAPKAPEESDPSALRRRRESPTAEIRGKSPFLVGGF